MGLPVDICVYRVDALSVNYILLYKNYLSSAGARSPNKHKTLPKLTRRNLKSNKLAF